MADTQTVNIQARANIEAISDIPQYRFVGYSAAANFAVCGDGERAYGISEYEFDVSEDTLGSIVTDGEYLICSSAAIAVGAPLESTSTGKAVTATTFSATVPAGSTDVTSSGAQPAMTLAGSDLPTHVNAIALEAATAGDQIIKCKLIN